MAEESFSVEINDSIDDVVFGDDEAKVILIDEPIDIIEPIIKDDLIKETKRQKEIDEKAKVRCKEREEREKEFQDETDGYSKELKNQKRKEDLSKIWSKIFFIFKPSSWIKFIQIFEPLLLTLFIDGTLFLILFSLLYIMYIILNVDSYTQFGAIFRLTGTILLVILCVVIQLNSDDSKSLNKEG